MNISTKQKQNHRHRQQTCGCQGGGEMEEGRTGSLGLAEANYYIRMDKQQGPTVQHRELYSVSYDKPQWKRLSKRVYVQSRNRDTGVENKLMDIKGGRGWDELGDWD